MQHRKTDKFLGPRGKQVYDALKRDLLSFRFKPGEKLPTEMELCRMYGISRSCLRQALNALHDDGLIFSRQGSGSYVKDYERPDQAAIISVMYHGGIDTVRKIQQLVMEKDCIMSLFSQLEKGWEPEVEKAFLSLVLKQKHRGLLASCTPTAPTNEKILSEIKENGTRVIHIEPFSANLPDLAYLMPDYRHGGYTSGVHLMLQGYEELFFIGDKQKYFPPFLELSFLGFAAACKEHQRSFSLVNESKLLKHLAGSPATSGIFCGAYLKALEIEEKLFVNGLMGPNCKLMGMELAGDVIDARKNIDTIRFDRDEILRRAIQYAAFPVQEELKTLMPPSIETVKSEKHQS